MPSAEGSLEGLRVCLVGAGRVGSSLAGWLIASGGQLTKVTSRRIESATRVASRLGSRAVPFEDFAAEGEELLFIAVADPALSEVVTALAEREPASVALHTSGRHSAEVLAPLRPAGTAVGSMHPLRAFASELLEPERAPRVVFGIDGDSAALNMAGRLVDAWKGEAIEIPAAHRDLYHLGATMAAGGVLTLVTSAIRLAESLGVGTAIAGGYLELARGAIEQARHRPDPAAAITGPVARGELEGFRGQIERLASFDPELAELVLRLADRTLLLRRDIARHE